MHVPWPNLLSASSPHSDSTKCSRLSHLPFPALGSATSQTFLVPLSEKRCLETKTCAKATLFKSNQAGLPLVAQVQQGFGPFPGDLSPPWLQLLGADAPVSPLPWAQTSGNVPLPTWHAYICQPTRVPDCMCQIGLCLPMQGTRVLITGPGRFHMPQSN